MLWTTYFLIFLAILTALLFAGGFMWAVKTDQFKDVEEPKYQMLRDED
ncbi:MAG: cbb3-type cytochrome oxidase assembly protein [bacterium]|nr:cbb3-type cytochrome oxidase assembly protein [bacterium]